jgi:hypothetical protein
VKILLILLNLFNLIDTAATLYFTQTGIMIEVNPVMNALLRYPELFVFVKVWAFLVISVFLWKRRNDIYARVAAVISATFYGLLATYYVINYFLIG